MWRWVEASSPVSRAGPCLATSLTTLRAEVRATGGQGWTRSLVLKGQQVDNTCVDEVEGSAANPGQSVQHTPLDPPATALGSQVPERSARSTSPMEHTKKHRTPSMLVASGLLVSFYGGARRILLHPYS